MVYLYLMENESLSGNYTTPLYSLSRGISGRQVEGVDSGLKKVLDKGTNKVYNEITLLRGPIVYTL